MRRYRHLLCIVKGLPACERCVPASYWCANVCSQELTRTVVLELCDEGTAEVAFLL